MAWSKLHQGFLLTGYIEDQTNNREISLDKMIASVAVKKDFFDNIFPLYIVNLQCDYETREILRTSKTTISIECDEYQIDGEVTEEVQEEPAITNKAFSVRLKIFDPNLQEIDIKHADDELDDRTDSNVNQTYLVPLTCIPENVYNQNNEIINSVYYKASMNEILVDILYDSNRLLYLDPSDNVDREETLLIPQMNKSNAISYLQSSYGIYEDQYSLFFDDDATYLIKQFNKNYYTSNKLSLVVVSQNDLSASGIYENIEIDEDNNLKKTTKNNPNIVRVDDVASNIIGGKVIFGTYGSAYELVTRDYTYDDNESKIRYRWNGFKKDIFEKSAMYFPTKTGTVVLENISPRLITLKTKVEVQSSDAELAGSYYIQSMRYIFGSTNKKNFNCSIVLTIAKK